MEGEIEKQEYSENGSAEDTESVISGSEWLGFQGLLATEFLSAFNDNLMRQVLALMFVGAAAEHHESMGYAVLQGFVFYLPFVLSASYAGQVADRFAKCKVIMITKIAELFIVFLCGYAIIAQDLFLQFAGLFLMGVKSAFFSAPKYAIIPEILSPEKLSKGNGYFEACNFAAIIGGTAISGFFIDRYVGKIPVSVVSITLVACLGIIASFFVPPTKAARPDVSLRINPWSVMGYVREIMSNRSLRLVVLGICFFWFIGVVANVNAMLFGRILAGWSAVETSLLIGSLGLGIGLGSIFAGFVSEGKVELGLVPIGASGITVTLFVIPFSSSSWGMALVLFGILGFCAGVFYVPLNAYLQRNSPQESRGNYIAATNFLSFSAMLGASLIHYSMLMVLELNSASVFVSLGFITIGVTVASCYYLPEMLLRAVNWMFAHAVYRLHVRQIENLPKTGGALLVCNHVSYADACLLLAATERPIRFLMYRPIYEHRLINIFARIAKAIPIASEASPKQLVRSLSEAREAIRQGDLVCIFAEGSLTRLGNLLSFQRGLERLIKGVDAPIIPVHLDQLWGSIFSFSGGKFFWKWPRTLPYPVTISFGSALPATSSAARVRQAVWELSAEAFPYRQRKYHVLPLAFIKTAKDNLMRPCLSDSSGTRLTYFRTLAVSLMLRSQLGRELSEQKMVGVLLPATSAGVLVNLALGFLGKVAVNLNFTAGAESLRSAINQCEIKTIISSRKFAERVPPPEGSTVLMVEDLIQQIPFGLRVRWGLVAALFPAFLIERIVSKSVFGENDLATVIFSSGSSGEPKGVQLSHRNISSNLHALYDIFQLRDSDCVIGVLPFFHSFGYTATLWLPLLAGIRVAYHPNPLDAEAIGKLVSAERGTIMLITPTFLSAYTRKCQEHQFKTLRLVLTGAEKLRPEVAQAFRDKFGVTPLEGYGATELSPVVSLNIPDYEVNGMRQVGNKAQTVGHPIPGVAVRVVNAETMEVLGPNEEGLLIVKGPNVMLGYLGNPDKTNEVVRGGWYHTGDIACIDEDGFIRIVDRLSRFSKIAGEMVPHARVEGEIQEALGESEQICAVIAVADSLKGERLVVFHTKEINIKELSEKLIAKGLPNLWIPKANSFLRIDQLPMLGSGKLDLRTLKEKAKAMFIKD